MRRRPNTSGAINRAHSRSVAHDAREAPPAYLADVAETVPRLVLNEIAVPSTMATPLLVQFIETACAVPSFFLPRVAADYTDLAVSPPGPTSPYGAGTSTLCTNTL